MYSYVHLCLCTWGSQILICVVVTREDLQQGAGPKAFLIVPAKLQTPDQFGYHVSYELESPIYR